MLPSRISTLKAVRSGGKPALARTLAAIETHQGTQELADLLDEAVASPQAHVLGLTGPPGVGKSTLTRALVARARAAGERVSVLAVDPSSRLSGGALLGDRTRLASDPDDEGLFVRSMAARDRLGGLSDHAVAAMVVMRALADLVIVETVGIGQSEADVATVADTVVLCIQPGSGDALQFMKAGVMELPDVVAITKADMHEPARRARADVEGALGLAGPHGDGWRAPVVMVSALTDTGMATRPAGHASVGATCDAGIDALCEAIAAHRGWLEEDARKAASRRWQATAWIEDAVRVRWGTWGLSRLARDGLDPVRPFETLLRLECGFARLRDDGENRIDR